MRFSESRSGCAVSLGDPVVDPEVVNTRENSTTTLCGWPCMGQSGGLWGMVAEVFG